MILQKTSSYKCCLLHSDYSKLLALHAQIFKVSSLHFCAFPVDGFAFDLATSEQWIILSISWVWKFCVIQWICFYLILWLFETWQLNYFPKCVRDTTSTSFVLSSKRLQCFYFFILINQMEYFNNRHCVFQSNKRFKVIIASDL